MELVKREIVCFMEAAAALGRGDFFCSITRI